MKLHSTDFKGLYEITPEIYRDERGYFFESFRASSLESEGLSSTFVQDNQSKSSKNVLRGLHLQVSPHEQIKLVRVIAGKVLDIVVDLRKNSVTFGKHYKCILDGEKGNMLYIPEGFAHGFKAIEDTIFSYKCSSYFHRDSEDGIIFDDSDLNIDWEIQNPIISEKDKAMKSFEQFTIKYDLA